MKTNLTVRTNETIQAPSKVSFSDQISPRMASVGASSNLSSPGRKGKNDLAKLFQNQSKSDTKRLATSHSSYRSSPPIYTQTSTLQLSRKTSSNKVSQMNTFAELLNKIADPGSQNVYEPERETQIQFGSARTMSLRESPVSRTNKFTIRQVSNRNTLMEIKSAQTSPKSGGNTITLNFNQSREENFEKSRTEFLDTVKEDHYKYSKLDSKFEEIQDLKSKNEYLQRENLQLKQDMVDIDEFDEVLKKKTRLENFNEKRCDILKACVRKQKRYIDYMNKTVRMSKTFYKDINHILNFLIELDQKYVKSGLKIDKQALETLEPSAIQVDMADRGFVEIYKELRNTENVKRFFENFNESYRQLKKMEESNVEIEKLFTLAGRDEKDKAVNPITLHFHPELKKKLKYKYVFKQFINKYNLIYPIYTVFNEFELRDKNNFSNFVDHLSLMSDRISKVFSRIKNFDMLSHTNFAYNHGISEIVVKNKMEFKDYFDRKNPNKRIFLKSEEVFQVERSLSTLLTNLITFHNNLATKKEDIPIESVLDLQESLRGSIENLLLLGITTTCDFSMGDKILVVTKKNPHGGQSDFLREGYIPEKETLFEVYNQEEDHLHKYQTLKNSINNLLKESLKEAEKTRSESMNITIEKLKKQVDSLHTSYEEMGLISRLKDMEMNYMREYSRIAFKDIEKLRIFVEEKLGMVDNTLKGIDGQIKDLDRSCGDYLAALKDTKDKIQFQKKFNRVSKEVSDVIQAILSKQTNSFYSDISMLENTFKTELEKLKKELLRSGDKIKDVTMKIRKG